MQGPLLRREYIVRHLLTGILSIIFLPPLAWICGLAIFRRDSKGTSRTYSVTHTKRNSNVDEVPSGGFRLFKYCAILCRKTKTVPRPKPTGLLALPWEIQVNIASFCSYSTVLSLAKSCSTFRSLLQDLTLIRNMSQNIYHDCHFNNAGTWSATHLDLHHAKSVSIAMEMTIQSAGKSAVPVSQFLTPGIILAVHSHPLIRLLDVNTLQICLCVAQYYKMVDLIPDIAFCLMAATLEQEKPGNHYRKLRSAALNQSEGLYMIAFLVTNLYTEDLKATGQSSPQTTVIIHPF